MSFVVRVLNSNGDPVSGCKVVLGFTSIFRGMSSTEYTDSRGRAHFSGYESGAVNVYVDGDNCGEYEYEDYDEITITI